MVRRGSVVKSTRLDRPRSVRVMIGWGWSKGGVGRVAICVGVRLRRTSGLRMLVGGCGGRIRKERGGGTYFQASHLDVRSRSYADNGQRRGALQTASVSTAGSGVLCAQMQGQRGLLRGSMVVPAKPSTAVC